jgi:hypothetical protein
LAGVAVKVTTTVGHMVVPVLADILTEGVTVAELTATVMALLAAVVVDTQLELLVSTHVITSPLLRELLL